MSPCLNFAMENISKSRYYLVLLLASEKIKIFIVATLKGLKLKASFGRDTALPGVMPNFETLNFPFSLVNFILLFKKKKIVKAK